MTRIKENRVLDSTFNPITSTNPFAVREHSLVDTGNSTSTPLLADAVFTGTPVEILQYGVVSINIYSDVASAVDGLEIQQSVDGISDWHWADNYSIPAGTGKSYQVQPSGDYLRIVYTNGALDQTNFHIHVVLHPDYIKPSSHRIQDDIINDDDAELVKAVLTGENGSSFTNVKVTQDGNLSIVNKSDGLSIAAGDIAGYSFVHKFGNAPDFDTTDGIVTIWDGADDANINQMVYQYSTTAAIDSLSSSSASDTFSIIVEGLDTNWAYVSQTLTLTGQTRVALTTNLIRVFRLQNNNSVDNVGHIYCYENTAIVAGVPTDTTKVRAVMQPLDNQTLMALYSVPAGETAYLRSFFSAIAGANKSSNYTVDLRIRSFGKVFNLRHRTAIADNGTSSINHIYIEPPVIPEKSDIEMRVSANAVGATAASISAGFDLVKIINA